MQGLVNGYSYFCKWVPTGNFRVTDGRLFHRHVDDVLHQSEPNFSQAIDTENSEWLGVPMSIKPAKTENSTDGDPAPPQVQQQ